MKLKGMKLEGFDDIVNRIKELNQHLKLDTNTNIMVGYAANHSTIVHETNANYNDGKQWKYLETPAKALQGTFARELVQSYRTAGSVRRGLRRCANTLYAASQELVPVDTGELKASGFVAWENELEAKSQAAYKRGRQKRLSTEVRRTKQRNRARADRRRRR